MNTINPVLISVIVPIYNVEKYLPETITSVCKQTYKNLEIILVNDGSNDNSPKICNDFALKDKRIIVVNKLNGGLSSARNAGIDIAKGSYIFFLDGDDFIETETIETLLNGFSSTENIGIVSAPCFYSYSDGVRSIYRKDWDIKNSRIINYKQFCIATLKQECCHSACCKLYKKNLLQKVRFREGRNNEDTLFMFDISFVLEQKQLNLKEIPKPLYYYRINLNSLSRNTIKPLQIDIIDNILCMINEVSDAKILSILKHLYYKQLLYFNLNLSINPKLGDKLHSEYVKTYNEILLKTSIIDVYNNTSFNIAFKYFCIRYFKKTFLLLYKIKNG